MANVTENYAAKRKSVPFTPKMDAALAAAYKEEKETIEGAFKGTKLSNRHKLEAWGRVRDCVNSVAGENEKTITQCKDRHRNLVQSIMKRKYQVAATGGGSEPPPLTPAQQLLEGTLPKEKLEGIDGPLDTFKGSLISEEAKEASILDEDEGDQLLYMVEESVFQTLGEACRELEMRQMDTSPPAVQGTSTVKEPPQTEPSLLPGPSTTTTVSPAFKACKPPKQKRTITEDEYMHRKITLLEEEHALRMRVLEAQAKYLEAKAQYLYKQM